MHAAGESAGGAVPPDTHGALLVVPDELALALQAVRLRERGLEIVEIREDRPPYSGELMAIGVRPGPRSTLKPHFGGLPCLREERLPKR